MPYTRGAAAGISVVVVQRALNLKAQLISFFYVNSYSHGQRSLDEKTCSDGRTQELKIEKSLRVFKEVKSSLVVREIREMRR